MQGDIQDRRHWLKRQLITSSVNPLKALYHGVIQSLLGEATSEY